MYEFLQYQIRDVMTVDPIAISPKAKLREAEELFETHDFNGAPEVALIDYKLEDTRTGLDVADTLRSRFPDIGLVIVTGESDADVLQMLKESDMPLLEKPVSPHELRLTLSLFRTAID